MSRVGIENTNLENGVTNRNAADIFGAMGQLDPTKFVTLMDEFNRPVANALTLAGYFDIATGSVAAVADQSAVILTTGAVAANAAVTGPVTRGFSIVQGRPLWFSTRVALGDVANTILVAGLADAITGVTPDDGVFFQSLDTLNTLDVVVRSGAAQVAIDSDIGVTLVDDDNYTLALFWDGVSKLSYAVNGVLAGSLDLTGLTLPADEVGATVGPVSGAAGNAVDVTVDHLFCAQER